MPIFGAKSRAMRGCASKLACGRRIDPADCTVFTEICGEFATSRWADRVAGPYNTALSVGADDSVRPQNAPAFTEIYCEFAASQRADVGIGPYRALANPHCLANFERKANLTQ